jgi:hypothetical protein
MKALIASLLFVSLCAFAKDDENNPAEHFAPSAEQTLQDLHEPWGKTLGELRPLLKDDRSYVFWIMGLPEMPLDLRSAEHFRRFLRGNGFFAGGVSHNMVAWSCRGKFPVQGAAGMTGESYRQSRKMLQGGFGLTTFFSTFTDGFLQGSEMAEEAIGEISKKYGLAVLGFEVSHSQCESVLSFAEDFANAPNQPYLRFGLGGDPLKMNGGGCVNFAMALLQQAGILGEIPSHYYRNFSASEELFGGGLEVPAFTELPVFARGLRKNIPLDTLLRTPWVKGARNRSLSLMDPELMLYTMKVIKKVYLSRLPEGEARAASSLLNGPGLGDRWVRSGVDDPSSPEIPDFRYYRIDSTFDEQTARVGTLASNWMQNELSQGKRVRLGTLKNQPVLLIENP